MVFVEYKKSHPNAYSLYVSVLLALWFNGISTMINFIAPNRGFWSAILLMIIPIIFFFIDSGTLEELYKDEEAILNKPIIAAITQSNTQSHIGRESFKKEFFNDKKI